MSPRRPPEAIAFEREFPGARWLCARCARELEVVGGLIEAAIAGVARRYGLSHAALNALAVIEGEGQPMLIGEVASRMHITSGTITSLIDNLERKGYVLRSSDADDRRRVLVDITPAAQSVLDDLLPEVQQLTVALIDHIGQKRQEALLDILAEIRQAINDLPHEMPAPPPRRRPDRLTR
ncbi:MAG TPA: MarR family transcriptional regulator [Acidimicrobiia bacterium]|nr:MarR family transcriptional regulator [Acidimicrobiia bacterium]